MRLRHLALPAAAGLVALALPFAPAASAAQVPTCNGQACTASFALTGAPQQFVVPAGVTELAVGLAGGSGGTGHPLATDDGPTEAGGAGGAAVVVVAVTPGETLTVVVGGRGEDFTNDDNRSARGGYGGGGAGTTVFGGSDGAGGGGSFLFRGGAVLAAVGGGGGGGFVDGGKGGTGGAGTDGTDGSSADFGGGGATTTAPGAAGGGEGGQAGTGPAHGAATFGTGGVGQPVDESHTCPAGGGGGGYYGGGAGGCRFAQIEKRTSFAAAADDPVGAYGGGGGGSGFLATDVAALRTGTHQGDGRVLIGYDAVATHTALTTDATTLAPGQEANLVATVTGATYSTGAGTPAEQAVEAQFGLPDAPPTGPVAARKAGSGGGAPPVTAATACGTPCTVTFFVNGTQLGDPVRINTFNNQVDIVFTAGSALGVRHITARYNGAAPFLSSTSAPVDVTVSGLADTGPSNVAPMLTTSAALLVVGAGLVGLGRRRPSTGSHRAA